MLLLRFPERVDSRGVSRARFASQLTGGRECQPKDQSLGQVLSPGFAALTCVGVARFALGLLTVPQAPVLCCGCSWGSLGCQPQLSLSLRQESEALVQCWVSCFEGSQEGTSVA